MSSTPGTLSDILPTDARCVATVSERVDAPEHLVFVDPDGLRVYSPASRRVWHLPIPDLVALALAAGLDSPAPSAR